jgi:hypothetical protein
MPIRPENRLRYPKDWKRIAEAIRERAGNRCEGSPAFPDCRAANGEPHPVTGSRVVLTVAHLDHTPEHCDPQNLRALCQRCHLIYDADHHRRTAYATRRRAAAMRDLFSAANDKHNGSEADRQNIPLDAPGGARSTT